MQNKGVFTNQQWVDGKGLPFQSTDPANGSLLWEGRSADSSQVQKAIRNAKNAFQKWASLSFDERAGYLAHFRDILSASQNQFAEIISKETGKPLWDSLGEVKSMINKIPLSIEAYHQRCSTIIKEASHSSNSITRHKPHGVLAVLGPFNFPGHLPNGHIIPGLLAGNTIVFKPSELTPLVAEKMIECWEKAHLPSGVINLVQGGKATGQALIQDPAIDGLLFTGSAQTGLYLSELFASQPSKILALEMGGNNPLVIGEIDDLLAASYQTIQSAYLSSGQRCTCARRLIIRDSAQHDALLETLIKRIKKISIGPYTDSPEPFMGPVISAPQAESLIATQKRLQDKGGIILHEMQILKPGSAFITPGLMEVTNIDDRPDEEIFGPFLQVIRVKDIDESIEEANRTRFGLSAGIFSNNEKEYQRFYQQVQAGIINWNLPLTGASSAAPFGGIKNSGNFRPSAYYAADYCSYPTASFETPTLQTPSILLPGLNYE